MILSQPQAKSSIDNNVYKSLCSNKGTNCFKQSINTINNCFIWFKSTLWEIMCSFTWLRNALNARGPENQDQGVFNQNKNVYIFQFLICIRSIKSLSCGIRICEGASLSYLLWKILESWGVMGTIVSDPGRRWFLRCRWRLGERIWCVVRVFGEETFQSTFVTSLSAGFMFTYWYCTWIVRALYERPGVYGGS